MKKQSIIILVLVLLTGIVHAQGIQFETGLSWQQVKAKARAEKKFIFLDFMATWCGPCKAMDNLVYNQKEVGDALNTDFISVKLQQDKTPSDSEFVKSWYADAADLFKKYEITSFPTLMFLSPTGEFLHIGKGFHGQKDFLNLVAEAKEPSKQYVLLNSLKDLLTKAKKAKAVQLEQSMAKDYMNNFLVKLPKEQLYTKSNLSFLVDYVSASDKAAFQVFYPDATKAKAVLGDGPVHAVMNRVIANDIVNPMLYKNGKAIADKPDWAKIEKAVIAKYGKDNLETTVVDAKVEWFKSRKEWNNMAAVTVVNFENHPWIFKNHMAINSVVWDDFFPKVTDKKLLRKAADWMRNVVDAAPDSRQFIDTYANVLHKLGETSEAIKWQEKAVEIENRFAKKDSRPVDTSYQATLDKMRSGQPTWPN